MAESKKFLDEVYDIETPLETRAFYDDWADSYEAEIGENGYVTPGRIARALAAYSNKLSQPVLDFGCGTGLSGVALLQAGFTTIDGADLSSEMLQGARDKGLYRKLWQIDPDTGLKVTKGDYAAITAMGVIGSGAAPVEVVDDLMAALDSGGLFALSYNDHTLQDPVFEARLHTYVDEGTARLIFQEYGDHLPGRNLKSTIYILEKT